MLARLLKLASLLGSYNSVQAAVRKSSVDGLADYWQDLFMPALPSGTTFRTGSSQRAAAAEYPLTAWHPGQDREMPGDRCH
jgi:hypothetical protein